MTVQLLGLLTLVTHAFAATYSATSGTKSTTKISAPVGVSLEFFAFPAYVDGTVPSTATCLANLKALNGIGTPVRIGGTTQDRALYNATQTAPVIYTTPSAGAAPDSLTYGPSFMALAQSKLDGDTTFGVNRRLNQLSNSIAAITQARSTISKLYAIELGNEPEFYGASSPIAQANGGTWTPAVDAQVQQSWQTSVGVDNLIQAGVFLQPPTWSTAKLAPLEQTNGKARYVKSFSGHSYPQSACGGASTNLTTLMSHSNIKSYTSQYKVEAAAANAIGKPYFLAETNSATCGGGGISPEFGSALWIVDYVMQAILNGVERLYFHQGTIGNCPYCWWGRYSMGAPYYGAYMAADALAGISSIAQLDDGTTSFAAYALYDSAGVIKKVVLYNSVYYVSGTRPSQSFTLTNLPGTTASAKRLTAPAATSRQDQGAIPTYGGISFVDGTCAKTGTAVTETTAISSGSATFSVLASQALLVTIS